MPRVNHFEIFADDPQRAIQFYTKVFGWRVEKWNGPVDYWMLTTGSENEPGIDGAIARRERPADCVVNTINVPDLDAYLNVVKHYGGTIVAGKIAVPGVGWMAYCLDSEGNRFGLMQGDPNAK